MPKQPPEPEPPESEPPAAESQDLSKRVDSLEAGQNTILSKLDQLLGGKPAAPADAPAPAGNVADEIRAQLEERDRKAAADADARGQADTLAGLQAKVAELAEKPPVDMPTRRAKIMGWT
jgi:uncharacterized protein YceH (UPF0502 family)